MITIQIISLIKQKYIVRKYIKIPNTLARDSILRSSFPNEETVTTTPRLSGEVICDLASALK
jgi:hypothetical protein